MKRFLSVPPSTSPQFGNVRHFSPGVKSNVLAHITEQGNDDYLRGEKGPKILGKAPPPFFCKFQKENIYSREVFDDVLI